MKASRHKSLLRLALTSALLGTTAQAAVLLDQINSISEPSGYASQLFEAGISSYNIAFIDDFTVTSGVTVTTVETGIQISDSQVGAVQFWQVNIYSSTTAAASSLVGNVASVNILPAAVTFQPFGSWTDYKIASIPVSLVLPSSGTYYLSVLPRLDFDSNGQTFIAQATGTGGNNALQANPGGGFGFTGGLEPLSSDASYRLIGAIPEPSGTFTTAALLAATLTIRRRKTHKR